MAPALFFEQDKSRYEAKIFPYNNATIMNDVIYAQCPDSICMWSVDGT